MKEVFGCRDNMLMDLIYWGMDDLLAFNMLEHVCKGRGIPDDWQKASCENENGSDWYIDLALKIKYMSPKAQLTAYILMACWIAWSKVHYPLVYYTLYFLGWAEDFDLALLSVGKEAVKAAMKEITDKGMELLAKEKQLLTVLEMLNEALERGFKM